MNKLTYEIGDIFCCGATPTDYFFTIIDNKESFYSVQVIKEGKKIKVTSMGNRDLDCLKLVAGPSYGYRLSRYSFGPGV